MATLADPAIRAKMGQAARARAVRDYGWDAHCRALDAALRARI
jgi:glycosyltransferase involved in cell wall biosynthesis